MSSEVVRARGLSKCYAIFDQPADRLKQMIARGRRKYFREFWALNGVDLDLRPGEIVGVVGRNGSGKSTLLQLIAGILTPTSGELAVRGRVAALLELGAGFNPKFTGRENVQLNASILGLAPREIDARFPDIERFADIGSFIDQPVRRYSSGMFARLAFSVAINVDPDILVIDEALSVGDEAFQRKCFTRIHEIRERGGAVLFVSHVASAVLELCNRAVLFEAGRRVLTGTPKAVIENYHKLIYAPPDRYAEVLEAIAREDAEPAAAPAAIATGPADEPLGEYDPELKPKTTMRFVSQGAEIEDVRIMDAQGRLVNLLTCGEEYRYRYRVRFDRPFSRVRFGMLLKSMTGLELGGQTTHVAGEGVSISGSGVTAEVEMAFRNTLLPGTYFGNAGVTAMDTGGETYIHRLVDAVMFRVKPAYPNTMTGLTSILPDGQSRCSVRLIGE